jgi:hypothetical protein
MTPTPEGQNYQPIIETVLDKLNRPGALFARDEMEVMVKALESLTARFTEQAQAHAECHPAALCDGPEQVLATWAAAAKVCDEIVERHRKQNSCGRDVFCEDFGCADFEALANTFRARAAAQGE